MIRTLRTASVVLALLLCTGGMAGGQETARQSAPPGSTLPELPLRRDASDAPGSSAIGWIAVALVAVVAGTLYWTRRAPRLAVRSAGVSASQARSLTAHASLHVVEWEGERLLLACTAQSVAVLSRRGSDPDAAGPQPQVP
jgi:hypothetical protein